MDNTTLLACASASISVLLATYVIYDFCAYVSQMQKERFLEGTSTELDDVLIMIPPSKLLDFTLMLCAIVSAISMLAVGLTSNEWSWAMVIFVGVFSAFVSFITPRIYLRFLRKRRLDKFNIQLEDALTSMSSSLKAGFSINQALEAIAAENVRPISIEFKLLIQEIRLGVTIDDALRKMCDRLQSQDFELVTAAIITARQTGGALTETLERLARLIRERVRILLKLKAMTTQGKLQAIIIGLMPILLLYMMSVITPGIMDPFFDSILGILTLIFAAGLNITGFLIIRKITNIEV